jgi:uncharacterized cofD-like protein
MELKTSTNAEVCAASCAQTGTGAVACVTQYEHAFTNAPTGHNAPNVNTATDPKDYMSLFLKPLVEAPLPTCDYSPINAVVVGGGTGAPLSVKTLLSLGIATNAVIAMADDGSSTGVLRKETHASAPGDIRKCLLAFAKDETDPLTQIFGYRIACANNHSLGNLILSSLEEAYESFPLAIERCEELLHANGHVYPSTLDALTLCAKDEDGSVLRGQNIVSKSSSPIQKIWLENESGEQDIKAYEPACKVLIDANLIVLGPGSLFTSVIANLAIPGIVNAINKSNAKIVYVSSLNNTAGEAANFSFKDELNKLYATGIKHIDFVLVNSETAKDNLATCMPDMQNTQTSKQTNTQTTAQTSIQTNTSYIFKNFYYDACPHFHNPVQLRLAFEEVATKCLSLMK